MQNQVVIANVRGCKRKGLVNAVSYIRQRTSCRHSLFVLSVVAKNTGTLPELYLLRLSQIVQSMLERRPKCLLRHLIRLINPLSRSNHACFDL